MAHHEHRLGLGGDAVGVPNAHRPPAPFDPPPLDMTRPATPSPLRHLTALVGLLVLTGCRPTAAQDYQAVVDRFVERTEFNGVVLVARGDSVLYARPAGYEAVEDSLPTTLRTRYEVGSIAKWVTSLVVLSLAEDGALSLDEPVGTYLPGLRASTGRRVTLHHLLSNRAGIPNAVADAFREDPAALAEPLSMAGAVRRYASGDLEFEPGTDYDYSLSNWVVAQAAAERATGLGLGRLVRERVTGPLGLCDTDVFWDGHRGPRVAPGYESLSPPVRAEIPQPRYLASSGGMYSTAPDLLALVHGVYDGGLLSDRSLAALSTAYTPDDDLGTADRPGGYAYGGRVRTMALGGEPRTVLWHTGSNGPSKVRLSRVLSDGTTVITMTNAGTSPEATGALVEDVLRALYQ